ncbi:MAG: FliA/WhiG family RNA polymerase sigma factor [Magnetococcales bacterium]|nr:FliA/WhiG family RNA polymerase sigma factor [Magnetococcales bacterium]
MAATTEEAEKIQDSVDTWNGMTRDEVIIKFSPMVKYVAGRISMKLPESVELDDLIQVGVLGLIDAVSKYDPKRGIKFQTYAEFRVRGAILDELRATDWVPRAVRQVASQIQSIYQDIEGKKGAPAEDEDVAEQMGVSLKEFYQQLDSVRGISIISFDDLRPAMEEGEEWDVLDVMADPNVEDPIETLGLQEMRQALSEAIGGLPEKERLVVTLYYFEGLTMHEIGEVLGLTESRISQLHSKAALRMRARIRRTQGRN